jgi:xanthine dehydrogenase accessory factor
VNELDSIVSALREQPTATQGAVLTTVVHVRGSAYRRPGARMLILPDGRRFGSISGGCLEGDVCRKAWWFTEGGKPSVRVYDTSSDEEATWEFGLGCNGVVHVLFERVDDPGTREMLQFVAASRAQRRAITVATVIATPQSGATEPNGVKLGDRLLFDSDGVCGGSLACSAAQAEILAHARDCYLQQKSHLAHISGASGSFDVFVEWIGPPPALVVFGAGHDAQPLVQFAKELGWHVTIADGRANYATRERFPAADRVVVIDPRELLNGIGIARETAVVMMTHNYPQDAALLRSILPSKPRYLGILGPKLRTTGLLEEVGLPVTGIDLHAPVGLDLGSDAPVSIALAIVAEIQAVLHSRQGGMLKGREVSIHEPALESGIPSPDLIAKTEAKVCDLVG